MAKTSLWRRISHLVLTLGLAPSAFAGIGSSLHQIADVRKPQEFEVKLHNDIIFSNGGGFNIIPHFGLGLIEHYLDMEAFIGTGTTDFQIGALGKFNILPDVDGQVGFSVLGGASFLTDSSGSGAKIQGGLITTGALASKAFNAEFGRVDPYGALEVEFWLNNVSSVIPITLIGGSKWQVTDIEPWLLYGEFSVNLSNSLWGFSVGAGYPF